MFTRLKTWKSRILGRNLLIFGYPQKMSFRQLDEFFEIVEKIITMTCRGFSGSSDASAPEFSILERSYVAYFFNLASKYYTNLCIAGHDFLLHLVAATSSSISGPTRARAYRGCLRPFREVRLQREYIWSSIL